MHILDIAKEQKFNNLVAISPIDQKAVTWCYYSVSNILDHSFNYNPFISRGSPCNSVSVLHMLRTRLSMP